MSAYILQYFCGYTDMYLRIVLKCYYFDLFAVCQLSKNSGEGPRGGVGTARGQKGDEVTEVYCISLHT